MSIARYREARSKLLVLTDSDSKVFEKDFPELDEDDAFAKNAATARNLGDGAKVDSWIWTFGRLRGLSEAEKDDFAIEVGRFHVYAYLINHDD